MGGEAEAEDYRCPRVEFPEAAEGRRHRLQRNQLEAMVRVVSLSQRVRAAVAAVFRGLLPNRRATEVEWAEARQ